MPLTKQRVAELLQQADPSDPVGVQDIIGMPEEMWKAFSKFLSLVEEEAVSGQGSWVKREDIDHHVKLLDEALNPTQARSALARDPDLIDVVAQAIPVIQAGRVDNRELTLLRRVYEEARSFLRYNGIDQQRAGHAIDRMDDAIERVKQFDGGTDDESKS